ncbi:hypothetical protein EJS81_11950 [Enterobacter hormaechei]|nr:hypothetical protein EJS81_11950 [Enterobacter hormaechei]
MTLTKEWLHQTIAELEEERDATPGAVNEDASNALAAMKIALASLEAEPVAYIFKHPAGRLFWSLTDESNKGQSDVMPVYTAQPAPVFVPDELTREEYNRRFMEDDDFDATFRGGWNAHRAAMLQGAENAETPTTMQIAPDLDSSPKIAESPSGNSPVIPDCWCRTCRPVVLNDMRFVVCPDCGNKRCPRANDHKNSCTGSNEPGQEGSAYPAPPAGGER